MPKLPLDPSMLRKLPEVALGALRHPRRAVAQIVSGSRNAAESVLDLRHVIQREGHEPGPVAAPPTEAATTSPASGATSAGTDEATVEDTVSDLGGEQATPAGAPVDSVSATVEEPGAADATEAGEASAQPDEEPDSEPDEEQDGPLDVRPEGPAPHMPPRIAGAVERDYADDIPGINNGDR